jgi:PAS domain S-box-containing protein
VEWAHLFVISALSLFTTLMVIAVSLTWPRRQTPGADLFTGLILAATLWAVTNALEAIAGTLDLKILISKIQYFSIVSIAPFWLLFCLAYTRQFYFLRQEGQWLIWVVPAITAGLAWTNERHGLIWTQVQLSGTEWGSPGIYTHGLWFWVETVYSYVLIVAGAVVIYRAAKRYPNLYRRQSTSLLAGAVFPIASNLAYLAGYSPVPGLDLTPAAFLFTTAFLGWGLFRYRFLDMAPIAREAVMEHLLDCIVVVDRKQRIVDMNPGAEQMFQVERNEVLGEHASRLFSEWETLDEKARQAPGTPVEFVLEHSERRDIEVRRAELRDNRQRPIGSVMIIRDITARKQQEETMLIQNVALKAAADGIVITDPNGSIIWVNPAFTTITGYAFNEVNGRNLRILKSERQDTEFYRKLWETISNGKVWRGELVNRRKNGELYSEEMTITPVLGPDGMINNFIAIKQDITRRKQAEAALIKSNQDKQRLVEAEAVAQERNRIAQEIHDGLAQNLAALRMRLSRWRRLMTEKTPELMQTEIDEVEEMVNESLLEARRSIYALRPLALSNQGFFPAVRQFVKGFGEYYQLNVQVDVEGPEDCLPRHLELTMFRIIQEALNNTARHAEARNAWVYVDLSHPKEVVFFVRDDGKGFDTHLLHSAERDGHIGLQAMQERVMAANGQMSLSSRAGHGTEVQIVFPKEQK